MDLMVEWVASEDKQYATFIYWVLWEQVIFKPARLVQWFLIKYLRESWGGRHCVPGSIPAIAQGIRFVLV